MKLEKAAETRKWKRVVGHVKIMMLHPSSNGKPLMLFKQRRD